MNYSGISECDVLNGPGFRVVLFVSGCGHMCHNCHNQKTWDQNFGSAFTEKTKAYLFQCLSNDYIDGITLSGGDPLYESNLQDIYLLIKEIRKNFPGKTIWLYTGFTWEEIYWHKKDDVNYLWRLREWIVKDVDVMVDGRYHDHERDLTLKWRGSKNQRLIDVKVTLVKNKISLYGEE